MSKLLPKPRGTQDILPTKAIIYQQIQQITQNILNRAGYQPVILPTYEYQELFTISVGEATDIIQKEMFAFSDRKGRQLVLRPEGTASVVRLVYQNKLVNPGYPLRLYYWGNMFRYERPQDGRYREFWQLGVELINANGIMADGELLWLIKQIIITFDLKENTVLHWNYLGGSETREKYKSILKEYLLDKELCLDCQRRYQLNPLRILDCKVCKLEKLPSYQKVLEKTELAYLKKITKKLDELKINHYYNKWLVRGLDYYTGIVFELSLNDDKQVILGGGRYDKLFQQLGEKEFPATGFALGVDRLVNYLSLSEKWKTDFKPDVLFLILEESVCSLVASWQEELSKNCQVVSNLEVKKVKNLLKNINYYSPRLAIIIGKKELKEKKVLVKDCQKKKEFIVDQEKLVSWIHNYLIIKQFK
ncbi:histidine--tRNA ligase [endosymbiont GvMRE of Glomus versiforme]|uniref:histidine--tRNA ligase n=1 Tax=endosymbiont GvMRE of Glomus versiforme TaxID=2039283 RepID=UPI000EB82A85|nr:histidine--tRNA ligase [endosymbiont GvMRE of Glomus versiforme]RHZ36586.1 Histidine--tRNA ligase [endosymbiont GvMRE of Glomus versiforme]